MLFFRLFYFLGFLVSVSGYASNATSARSTLDSSGNICTVWVDMDTVSGMQSINVVWTDSLGNVSAPQVLFSSKSISSDPEMAVDSSGNVCVIWTGYVPNQGDEIMSCMATPLGSWGSVVIVSEKAEKVVGDPQLTINNSTRRFLVTWLGVVYPDATQHVRISTGSMIDPWSTPISVDE